MRILVRTSKWALWSRRLGSFGLPLMLVPVLMHRGGGIDTNSFAIVELLALVVAALALLTGLVAVIRIWFTGDLGWGLALTGLLLGLICLLPLGYFGYAWRTWPMADDVTTDSAAPPPLVSTLPAAYALPDDPARLAAAFPGVRDRTYPVGARRVYDIALQLVGEQGWAVLQQQPPDIDQPEGDINAVATTLLGFRDEVAIRMTALQDGGTRVSMRSAALAPLHEPGANGRRVESFLAALDDRISQLQQDQSAGAEDDADQPPIPAPAPPRGKRR